MSKQIINIGSGIGTHDGDGARTGAQKINENFTEVYDAIDVLISDSSIYNKIIASTGFSLTGQNLTINANWEWILNNVAKTNPANVVINIPFCSTGKSRIEYVVPNNSNGFTRIIGAESATIPVAPQIPNEDMYVTWYTVDDGSVGTPSLPVIGEHTMSKLEKLRLDNVNGTGSYEDWTISDQRSCFNFSNAVTEFKSFHYHPEIFAYDGKMYTFKNSQETPVTLFHNAGTGIFKFRFPNAMNFVLQPNEVIEFRLKYEDTAVPKLEYIGVINSISTVAVADVVGLPAALAAKVTQTEIDSLGTQLLGGAPADGNTLKELNDKILVVQAIIGGSTADGDSLVNTVAELLAVFSTYSEGVDLVTLLAGKVNTTDIYNALDCIVAGKVLDARQGKVLNDLIAALTAVVAGKEPANTNIQLHIASAHAPSNAQKNSDITKAEIEAKLTGEITSHTHQRTDTISYAISAPTGNLTVGDADPFNAPYNFTLLNYWIGVKTAPTLSSLVVDVKKNGTSITSTKAGIDATEKTSLTGTSPVLTTTTFVKGDEITPNIHQVGSGDTGVSLKLYLEIIKT